MDETIAIPVQQHRRIFIPILMSAILCFIIGGISGYSLGKNSAIHAVVSNKGWLLQSVDINGTTTDVQQDQEIFLWWDIAHTPHNTNADWFIVSHAIVTYPPAKAKPLTPTPTPVVKVKIFVNDTKVDAMNDGQGNVVITGDGCSTNGTLVGQIMTITVPPNCLLFPEQANFFRTLTFVSSTLDAFNQSIIQVH